ncbi:uncharacterized protein ACO6RY_07976 [Pungitius sinensis]
MAKDQQKEIKLEEIGSISTQVKPADDNFKPCADSQLIAPAKTNAELELVSKTEGDLLRTCQAKLEEQMDINKKTTAALSKTQQDLKNVHLLWQNEKSSLIAEHEEARDKITAALKASQDSSQKIISNDEEMELVRDFCESQVNQQVDANIKLKAALDKSEQDLKASQDLLETERQHHQQKNVSKMEGDLLRTCQAKLEEQMDINKKTTAALSKTQQDLKNVHLLWQNEKSSLIAEHEEARDKITAELKASQDSSQKIISNDEEMELVRDFCESQVNQQVDANIKLKAALDKSEQDLKASQHLLETERQHHQQKNISKTEGEILRNCQAKLEEQMYINKKTTAALNKTQQDLKNLHLLWQNEKSSLTAKYEEARDRNEKLMAIITYHEREDEGNLTMLDRIRCPKDRPELQEFLNINFMGRLYGVTNSLEMSHQKYVEALENLAISEKGFNAKLYEANQEKERLAAGKKKCEDQLESERCQWQQEKASLQKLMLEKNAVLVVDLACEKKKNKDLLAAVQKAEQQAESRTIEEQQKKAEQQAGSSAVEWQQEKAEQQEEIRSIKFQLEEAEQQAKICATEWTQEKSSFKAQLEELYKELYDIKLNYIKSVQQKQETIEITKDLESTRDQLKKECLHTQELSSQLETFKGHCFAKLETQEKDHRNLIATLKKNSEDELKGERLLWQQEKSSLLQQTEQIQQNIKEQRDKQLKTESALISQLEDLQSRNDNRQRRRWYHVFSSCVKSVNT